MKILMINKFLHPNGGSETYIFQLGAYLQSRGHAVQYFGMEHEGRIVGNRVNAYTVSVDFHGGSKLAQLTYPIKTIYSAEARRKIRLVLDDFQPTVCHLNNFHYQLTPSIILEIRKWSRETGKPCKIVCTAHDSQLVCPNHLMQNPITGAACTKCLGGHFQHCVKGKCIHGSAAKSIVGALEGWFWNKQGVYRHLDAVIVPSRFLAEHLASNPVLKEKIVILPNFVTYREEEIRTARGNYVLYFGRYSKEKGIATLLQAVDKLPEISFVFAGDGPLKTEAAKRGNITDMGFLSGKELAEVISGACFSVVPSECFENCPFSVMESQMYGTPVLGADIGGIPELIRAGELFESGNAVQLKQKIARLWKDKQKLTAYTEACKRLEFQNISQYCTVLEKYYRGETDA